MVDKGQGMAGNAQPQLTGEQADAVRELAGRIVPRAWWYWCEPKTSTPGRYIAGVSGDQPGSWRTRGTSSTPEGALRNAVRNARRLWGPNLKYTSERRWGDPVQEGRA